jgi:hypothetical protein
MAKNKPRKPTPNQKAYEKELKRIKRFIKSAEKRGYTFPELELPEKPKRVTKKHLQQIQSITTKELYAQSTYYDPILDQRVSGTEEQHLIRSRASKKAALTRKTKKAKTSVSQPSEPPAETELVLNNLLQMIANWSPDTRWNDGFVRLKEHDKNVLANEIRGAINSLGEETVARNAEKNADLLNSLAWNILYGNSGDKKDGSFNADLVSILTLLRGNSLSANEAQRLQDRIDTEAYEDEEE